MFVIVTPLSSSNSDNTDTLLNQLIQFYSNNATNLYHLKLRAVRHFSPQQRDNCDVTSPYVQKSNWNFANLVDSYHVLAETVKVWIPGLPPDGRKNLAWRLFLCLSRQSLSFPCSWLEMVHFRAMVFSEREHVHVRCMLSPVCRLSVVCL